MVISKSKKGLTIILILVLLLTGSCGCIFEEEPNGDDKKDNIDEDGFEFAKEVDLINSKAASWLGTLDVDPIELRYEVGIKGKKKFVELLDSYLILYTTADNEYDKANYFAKVEELVNITNDAKYHDLDEINSTQFKQDSTSYLRAWYIMSLFGLNTTFYEQEIKGVIPRIDLHLPGRGINQKMVFVFYYDQLGYEINYTIEELFNNSVTRSCKDITELDNLDLYFITHEIFVLYDDNKMWMLTYDDIEYLKLALSYHVNRTIHEINVDLLAELVMVMTYLGFENTSDYRIALEYLLTGQNENGSFGNYEYAREHYAEFGVDVDVQLYLHTTEVALRALNEAVDIF